MHLVLAYVLCTCVHAFIKKSPIKQTTPPPSPQKEHGTKCAEVVKKRRRGLGWGWWDKIVEDDHQEGRITRMERRMGD